jgi:hypothetical protein
MNKRGQNWSFSLCNFSLKNRRGQFYLIAAIVIITIAVGFVIISNSASSQQTPNIYFLRDEIKIESLKIMDYATSNQLSGTQIRNTLIDFSNQYINSSKNDNFYFVFGNTTNMTFMSYQAYYSNVTLDGTDYTNLVGTGITYSKSFVPGTNVTLNVNGNKHIFLINNGVNFNFVLLSNAGGQNYTATSQ